MEKAEKISKEGRESMQRKKKGRKDTPIRYVVEHVYSGTESMEGLLTVVSEEAARKIGRASCRERVWQYV